jgi:hypothetical protein
MNQAKNALTTIVLAAAVSAGCASLDRTAQTIYQATQQTAPAEAHTPTASTQEPKEYTRRDYFTLLDESKEIGSRGIILEDIETEYAFHYTGRLEDGTPVGRLGALTYILNDKGIPVSPGLNSIVKLEEGEHAGDYVGNRGGRIFLLHNNGWPYISLNTPLEDGTVSPDELDKLLYKDD